MFLSKFSIFELVFRKQKLSETENQTSKILNYNETNIYLNFNCDNIAIDNWLCDIIYGNKRQN